MSDLQAAVRTQLARQVSHWVSAAERLRDLDQFASTAAFRALERYLGEAVLGKLADAVSRLVREGRALQNSLASAHTSSEIARVRQQLLRFRSRYAQTETTLDFFGDAINTRTDEAVAAMLRSCDVLAQRSMDALLSQIDRRSPPVLCYLDKGLGASVLKAGLRLWDGGSVSPVAAIKIVRHNLLRPTSLIHEAGHQVAHIADWNDELATAIEQALMPVDAGIASAWSGWASEIAADAFAFVQTGYASVAALHDVLAGPDRLVFRYLPGDPHPIGYLRVLLGVAQCRRYYGDGPWDDLATSWRYLHRLDTVPNRRVRNLLEQSEPLLGDIAAIVCDTPLASFGNRPLTALIDPRDVGPVALARLERAGGSALYTSPTWLNSVPVKLLALTGLRIATGTGDASDELERQQLWMVRLGTMQQAA